jgi:hypothetical protein
LTPTSKVTGVVFSFGTTAGGNITGVLTPEPSTAIVAMCGAVAFVVHGWGRKRRQHRCKAITN